VTADRPTPHVGEFVRWDHGTMPGNWVEGRLVSVTDIDCVIEVHLQGSGRHDAGYDAEHRQQRFGPLGTVIRVPSPLASSPTAASAPSISRQRERLLSLVARAICYHEETVALDGSIAVLRLIQALDCGRLVVSDEDLRLISRVADVFRDDLAAQAASDVAAEVARRHVRLRCPLGVPFGDRRSGYSPVRFLSFGPFRGPSRRLRVALAPSCAGDVCVHRLSIYAGEAVHDAFPALVRACGGVGALREGPPPDPWVPPAYLPGTCLAGSSEGVDADDVAGGVWVDLDQEVTPGAKIMLTCTSDPKNRVHGVVELAPPASPTDEG
jgi:hypothetical protein